MRRSALETAALVSAAFVMVTVFQCAPLATGGARTSITAVLRGRAPSAPTSLRWTVTLDEARASVETVRWFVGEPVFDARVRWPSPARWSFGVARAHPGHYTPGEALADVTIRRDLDLLGEPVTLGPIAAVTGVASSASVILRPGSQGTVRVRGTAARDGVTVRFRAALSEPIDVEGAPSRGEIAADGSTGFELSVDLGLWLDRADFAALSATSPGADGVIDAPAGSQARNALLRGVSNGAAYRFTQLPRATRP